MGVQKEGIQVAYDSLFARIPYCSYKVPMEGVLTMAHIKNRDCTTRGYRGSLIRATRLYGRSFEHGSYQANLRMPSSNPQEFNFTYHRRDRYQMPGVH